MIATRTFDARGLTPSRREALSYLRIHGTPDAATDRLLTDCIEQAKQAADCRCCWQILPISCADQISPVLRETWLKNHDRFIVFCATLGLGVDRLIARYAATSPARAAVLDAAAGALCEALCDTLTATLCAEHGFSVGARFSPGYGNFPLTAQQDIFRLLELARMGIGINESLLLSPAKTVTAIMGIREPSPKK